jgi:hypothetical protein
VAISTSEAYRVVQSRCILRLFSDSLAFKQNDQSTTDDMRAHLLTAIEKREQGVFRYDVLVHG